MISKPSLASHFHAYYIIEKQAPKHSAGENKLDNNSTNLA